ncbi:hypothetical protein LG201_01735 [Methylobacillus gramineus]|uniref:hypothetical protein n=1 Tax=Methylobacillus gramineus TaxID=755169 RepID=UPI001CFFCD60|nr:hypothetical protein [Methylobacillus gramineus]MCB5183923.1 hypothetical protein [Methylobacillus gramineus]
MFSINKESDIKEKAENLVEATQDAAKEVIDDTKVSAKKIGRKVQEKSRDSKKEALALLESLKDVLDPDTHGSTTENIIKQLSENFSDWSESLEHELSNALSTSRKTSNRWLRKRSLLTLSLAVGAGVLVGYALSGNSED